MAALDLSFQMLYHGSHVKFEVGRKDAMSLDDRLDTLKSKHETLEHEIENEERRPYPDEIHLHELKKQKLLLKDEIVGISS